VLLADWGGALEWENGLGDSLFCFNSGSGDGCDGNSVGIANKGGNDMNWREISKKEYDELYDLIN
jgi:hypothetical protein